MKKLLILGGGYGGMRILQRLLPQNLPADVEITLVDRNPYHCFKTEYYALVAGTVSDIHIRTAFPEHERLTFVSGEIDNINLDEKVVFLKDGKSLPYTDLIIGLGCEDKYHGVPGAKEYTFSLQTIEKARRAYEAINSLPYNSRVAIVGAGLSGVEVASELRESRKDLDILLFDRGARILSMFPERLSEYVENWFLKNNIVIVRHSNITKVEPSLLYNHDEAISCDAIIWTAGIQPSEIVQQLSVTKDNQGRVEVTPYYNIPDNDHVYVVGDCVSSPFSPSAQLAEAQGEQIATVLLKRWNNEDLPESLPTIKLKGILGSLGKKHGFGVVADTPLLGRVPRLLKSGLLWISKFN
ncbi:MAG: NAD(P)/FAD-dependent oxidoreductase [Bacillaceae bacterium]